MFSFLISFDSTQNYDFNFKDRKLSIIERRVLIYIHKPVHRAPTSPHLSYFVQPASVLTYM